MKKQVKEIWVRFESEEEYSENKEKLLALLDSAPGNCIVKIYVSSINGYKTESGHSFDEKQLSLLTDFLGESNAKYREVEVEIPKKLKRDVPKIVQLIPCTHDLYAVYGEDGGEKYKYKVLMFALCNDQQIYPLHFDGWVFVFWMKLFLMWIGTNWRTAKSGKEIGGKHEQQGKRGRG